jgi:hypothetical protein
MAQLGFKIVSKEGVILKEAKATDEISFVYDSSYQPGDHIVFTTDNVNTYYILQLDDALGEAFTYIQNSELDYVIPFDEKKISYSPKVFTGNIHLLTARLAYAHEIKAYKNLAKNVYDQHGDTGCFPHATANVETRGEAVFAARNAIDGVKANTYHGSWPYESWGINKQEDAEILLDFGRKVIADKIILYTRADFPHDNWWINVTFTFSDGTALIVDLEKSEKPHIIPMPNKTIEWIKLGKLIKSEDPSPFPALTQIEVYGIEA